MAVSSSVVPAPERASSGPTRRQALRLLGTAAAVVVATATVDAAWRADLQRPRVVVLGSGRRQLAALITAGEARLLLAIGDDPVVFGNALAQVRPITAPRIDLLLVAGSGKTLAVPAAIIEEIDPSLTLSLGPLLGADAALFKRSREMPVISGTRRIRLGDDLTVEVAVAAGEATEDGAMPSEWRLIVRHGRSTMVLLSRVTATDAFPPVEAVSCLILPELKSAAAWGPNPPPLVVIAGPAEAGRELRAAAAASAVAAQWGALVHPGEALPLTFNDGAISLPTGTAQPLLSGAAPPGGS